MKFVDHLLLLLALAVLFTTATASDVGPLVSSPVVQGGYLGQMYTYAVWNSSLFVCGFAGWFGLIFASDKGATYNTCMIKF